MFATWAGNLECMRTTLTPLRISGAVRTLCYDQGLGIYLREDFVFLHLQ